MRGVHESWAAWRSTPGRLTLRRAARPRTPCVVPRSISASMATSAGSATFFLPATSLIAERKHADQPAANSRLPDELVLRERRRDLSSGLFHGVRLLRVSSALRAHLDAGRCAGHEAGEALAQKEAGPARTRLCCRHRDVQTVRDFGHRQALDVVQDGHGTVVVR